MDPKALPVSDVATFVAIVECRSLSAAARRLRTSQPAVSKKLTQLESLFGTTLLSRSTRHLNLSEAGEELYRAFKAIMAEWDTVTDRISALSGNLRGILRVHAAVRIGEQIVAPAVAEFMQLYPDLTIILSLGTELVNVIEDGYDLDLRTGPPADDEPSKSVAHRTFGAVPFEICAAPVYLKRYGAPKSPRELAQHACVIHSSQRSPQDWPFKEQNKLYYVRVNGRLHSNNQTATYEATKGGLGIARIPRYVVKNDLKTGRLVSLFRSVIHHDTHFRAFYPRSVTIPEKTRSFLDHLESEFKKAAANN